MSEDLNMIVAAWKRQRRQAHAVHVLRIALAILLILCVGEWAYNTTTICRAGWLAQSGIGAVAAYIAVLIWRAQVLF